MTLNETKLKQDNIRLLEVIGNYKTIELNLKRDICHQQTVSTRLIVQRNTARFQNDKVKQALRDALQKAHCKIAKDITVLEMICLVSELVKEAWNKHEKIILENARLREENNLIRERNAVLKVQNKNQGFEQDSEDSQLVDSEFLSPDKLEYDPKFIPNFIPAWVYGEDMDTPKTPKAPKSRRN